MSIAITAAAVVGDGKAQTVIPALVELVPDGRLPIDDLITRYRFEDANPARGDMKSGKTVKPVLTF